MKDGVQNSQKSILLRRKGYSYSDISKELKVSKTSVANWLKNIKLTEGEKLLLNKSLSNKVHRSRLNASISLRSRKIFKEKKAFEKAEEDFKKYIKNSFFSLGLGLYWAKGSLSLGNIQFGSSKPKMILTMLSWMEKYLDISRKNLKFRLFVDFSENNETNREFWLKTLAVSESNFLKTVYQRGGRKVKKDKDYKGSVTFTFCNIEVVRKMIAWQKLMIGYYS